MVCIVFLTVFQADDHSSGGSISKCSVVRCCGWGRCVLIFRKNVMWIVFGRNTFLCYVSGNPWFFHAVFHHCSRVEAMLRAWGRDQDCWANDGVRLCFWIVSPCGTCTFYLCLFCFTFEQAFAHLRLIESLKKPAWLTYLLNSITSAVSDISAFMCVHYSGVCPARQLGDGMWPCVILPFQIKLYLS